MYHLRPALIAMVLASSLCTSHVAQAEDCASAGGLKYSNVSWFHARKLIRDLKKQLRTKSLLWLDMGNEAVIHRQLLERAEDDKDLCGVWLEGNLLMKLLKQIKVDTSFCDRKMKFVRELYEKRGAPDSMQKDMERAQRQLLKRRIALTNKTLTRMYLKLMGTTDIWHLPQGLVQQARQEEIPINMPTRAARRKYCPNLKEGQLSTEREAETLSKLIALALRKNALYPADLSRGMDFLNIMQRAQNAQAWTAYVAAACSLAATAHVNELSLGIIMKKFERIKALKEDTRAQMSAQEAETIRSMVREATAYMGSREYLKANASANMLLVKLGQPNDCAWEIQQLIAHWPP